MIASFNRSIATSIVESFNMCFSPNVLYKFILSLYKSYNRSFLSFKSGLFSMSISLTIKSNDLFINIIVKFLK